MSAPVILLCGPRAIGRHIGISAGSVCHLDRQRLLPTMRAGGMICVTPAALDEWQELCADGRLSGRGEAPRSGNVKR